MALLNNADELLGTQLPSDLDIEKVTEQAKEFKIKMELEEALDELSGQDWIKKQKILNELKSDAVNGALEELKVSHVPPYLFGEPSETADGISMEIRDDKGPYAATVEWIELQTVAKKLLDYEGLITPYSIRNVTGKGHGKSRTIVVYLWKEGAILPAGLRKGSGDFDSVQFKVIEPKLGDVISKVDQHKDTKPKQTRLETTEEFECEVCGAGFDNSQALQGHLTATGHREEAHEDLDIEKIDRVERTEIADRLQSEAIGELNLDVEKIPPYLLENPIETDEGIKMAVKRSNGDFITTVEWGKLKEISEFLLNQNGLVTPYVLRNDMNLSRTRALAAMVYLWNRSALIPADTQIAKDHISVKFKANDAVLRDVISDCESRSI